MTNETVDDYLTNSKPQAVENDAVHRDLKLYVKQFKHFIRELREQGVETGTLAEVQLFTNFQNWREKQ